MYDIIAKKKNGETLTREEIEFFVRGCVAGDIPDYQVSALLMAICLNGMTDGETAALTLCMAASGETVDLSSIPGIKVDKHSTGGVGDKTTLVVLPIAAACGVKAAKMSGRGLGHTGGTIDKLESIPGFRTSIGREEFFDIVRSVGAAVVGQSGNLVPADKKLYALRDVTATVDSIPLIASSIMSKKLAAGADRILLDVKTGSGAFMKTERDAVRLAELMVKIGEAAGRGTVALITDMSQPLGYAVGNSLEVMEACRTLRGEGPRDLTELCVELAANLLFLAGQGGISDCRGIARERIADGSAFRKFGEMVEAQGGDRSVLEDFSGFARPSCSAEIPADRDGYLFSVDAEKIGLASVELGAGRERKEDAVDPAAGVLMRKKAGDPVRAGEPIAVLYAASAARLSAAERTARGALICSAAPPRPSALIRARVTRDGVEPYESSISQSAPRI